MGFRYTNNIFQDPVHNGSVNGADKDGVSNTNGTKGKAEEAEIITTMNGRLNTRFVFSSTGEHD